VSAAGAGEGGRPAKAVAHFRANCNCAQAILMAYGPSVGLTEDLARDLGAPMGGGLAMSGSTCGAAAAASLVLGLEASSSGMPEDAAKDRAYVRAAEFLSNFGAVHGAVNCRDLIGKDLSTPEGREKARGEGVFETTCPRFVEGAGRILDAMLPGETGSGENP
jgi:C_GCAxxG_C_C family probable redox protein